MVSKPTDSASKPRKQLGEPANDALRTLSLKINQLKKQIQAERIVYIKVKLIPDLCCLSLILLRMSLYFYSLFAGEITFCFC
ncbi:hypothetical protein PHAVU_007G127900 [Phaseolus vulgaris]|uniref:Uncharacterized protein n=1 Tax=Phaseolus vulgaris TaxID=3885 RepID=V7BEU3_PHAVU|nr:hypothetical protein PHAVU_007G127900g [Phaseolus vulgaris]ESW16085.1 hypothetical protein PHAVU_007G127900g [Phaseolus vulgaris]